MRALRDGLRALRLRLDGSLDYGRSPKIIGNAERIYALVEAGAHYGLDD